MFVAMMGLVEQAGAAADRSTYTDDSNLRTILLLRFALTFRPRSHENIFEDETLTASEPFDASDVINTAKERASTSSRIVVRRPSKPVTSSESTAQPVASSGPIKRDCHQMEQTYDIINVN